MRAYGQKLVQFCKHTHTRARAAKLVVEIMSNLPGIMMNVVIMNNTHLLNEVIDYQRLLSYIMRARRENPEA